MKCLGSHYHSLLVVSFGLIWGKFGLISDLEF